MKAHHYEIPRRTPVTATRKHYLVTVTNKDGIQLASVHTYENPGEVDVDVQVIEL